MAAHFTDVELGPEKPPPRVPQHISPTPQASLLPSTAALAFLLGPTPLNRVSSVNEALCESLSVESRLQQAQPKCLPHGSKHRGPDSGQPVSARCRKGRIDVPCLLHPHRGPKGAFSYALYDKGNQGSEGE